MAAYVIIADDEVDQICDSAKEANREIRDLRAMGCKVRKHTFESRNEAEAWADVRQNLRF